MQSLNLGNAKYLPFVSVGHSETIINIHLTISQRPNVTRSNLDIVRLGHYETTIIKFLGAIRNIKQCVSLEHNCVNNIDCLY